MADWSSFPPASDPWSAFPAEKPTKGSGVWATDVYNDGKATVEGVINAVTSPLETAKGAFNAFVMGPASKLAHATGLVDAATKDSDPAITAFNREIEKQKAAFRERTTDAVVDQVKEDFSDPVYTATHKPFTTLNYISTIAAPGALLPGRAGLMAGRISNATNLPGHALNGIGRAAGLVGDYAHTAGRVDRAGVATRQALSDEFGVRLSPGQVADDFAILSREDNLRHARGGQSAKLMHEFDTAQDASITRATDRIREGLTGAQTAMGPDDVGRVLGEVYGTERQAARNRVSRLYDRAFDPAELAAAGVRADVPIESVYGLRNAIETAFVHGDRPMIPTPELTPATYRAIQMINNFSQTGGIRSSFNSMTMPPPGAATGQPLVTGISWQQMDQLRKHLNGLRSQARTNPADLAGMRRVLDVFDDQLGQMNPLLNQARDAHGMRMQRFEPQRTNAAGVNGFLQAIANESNPGKLIFDRLFNSNAIKSGTAGPLIEQLTQIMGHSPEAMSAIREGMLVRLTTNLKTGEAFSPKITSNNIRDALGGQSSSAYRMLFGADDLAQLGRYGDLLDQIGTTRAAQNASKTSYNLAPVLERLTGAVAGGFAGHGAGAAMGGAVAGPVGSVVGAALGDRAMSFGTNVLNHAAAQRTVTGQYTPPRVAPIVANGLAGGLTGFRAGVNELGGVLPPGILVQLQEEQERKRLQRR